MNRTIDFCTIERTAARTRLLLRHAPAQLPGPLTASPVRQRALQLLARDVAGRLNEERAPKRTARRASAAPAWLRSPALVQR